MADLTPLDDAKRLNTPPLQGRGRGWGLSAGRIAQLQERAAAMRRNPTEPEKRLWRQLSNSQLGGYKFRRQAVIGQHIADFACPQKALIVEVDGDTHVDPAAEARRDATLVGFGYRVVRFSNAEIMHDMDGVLRALLGTLEAMPLRQPPHPHPSPAGEGLEDAQRLLGISLEGSVG